MRIQLELITNEGAVFRGEAKLARAAKISAKSLRAPQEKPAKVNCRGAVKRLWQTGKLEPLCLSPT